MTEPWSRIAVRATFTGVRFLPWWYAIAHNNGWPLLELGATGVRYRVLRKRERAWSEVEAVIVKRKRTYANIRFVFRDRWLTFSANLSDFGEVQRALSLVPRASIFEE